MAALANDSPHPHIGNVSAFKLGVKCVVADTFYAGALVYGDAGTGLAQVSVPAAGDVLLGICAKTRTTTAANQIVEIYTRGLFALPIETPAEGDVGDVAVVDIDDGGRTDNPTDAMTGADATLAANDILVGKIVAINATDTSRAWVDLQPGWIYSALGWV